MPVDDRAQRDQAVRPPRTEKLGVMVIGLIRAGTIRPPLALERRYLDRRFTARVEMDGTVSCDGRRFSTLSAAASHARSSCIDGTDLTSVDLSSNGWNFWQFRDENGKLQSISRLRRRYLTGDNEPHSRASDP